MIRISMRRILALLALTALPILTGCPGGQKLNPSGATPEAQAQTDIRFRDVAKEVGLNYSWSPLGKRPLTILQTIGNGGAFLDYDNDGNLDILLVGQKPGMFQGDGKGKFTNVSATALGGLSGYFLGCATGDIDNDGFTDIYLTGYREGRLLRNTGRGTFSDITAACKLPKQDWGTSATFADLDRDGFLDLYVCNYVDFGPNTKAQLCDFPTKDKKGKVPSSCGPKYYKGIKGNLFQNLAGKSFRDVTVAWGAQAHTGKGLGVAAVDFDGSGNDSLAIANDEVDGNLFLGQGKGKLKDIGVESGTARDRDGSIHAGMGIDWGDFNNDGLLDLFVTTFRSEAKSLYKNAGDRFFSDAAYESGVGRPVLPYVSFGTKFLDADNDGWLDLVIASGHVQDNIEQIEDTTYKQPLIFLRNQGADGQPVFEDISQGAGIAALGNMVGRGLAVGDYDNDGRVDVLVIDSEGPVHLLHNESEKAGHWLLLQLQGGSPTNKSNRSAHGALITVKVGNKTLLRHCQTDGSYMSASDVRVHIGLGEATKAEVTVQWPGGAKKSYGPLDADKVHRLTP